MKLPAFAVAAATMLSIARAQNSTSTSTNEFVWGAVILNLFGDHIPLLSQNYSVITSEGQNQMYQTGQLFRERYLSPNGGGTSLNYTIQHIDTDALNLSQVNVTSMSEVWIQQSAQAFMEGLFPPLNDTVTSQTGGPLSSMQNPQYAFVGPHDPMYTQLNGSHNCPAFEDSAATLESSQSFQNNAKASQHWLDNLGDALGPSSGAFPDSPIWYGSSYLVWDWLQHQALNDSSLIEKAQSARYAADAYMQEMYGDTTADGGIRTIGGYMLATAILDALSTIAYYNANFYQLNTFFTGPEPWISLAALMQLTDTGGRAWEGMPDPGSSLVFELFSNATSTNSTNPVFPGRDALHVRVLLRNGTNSTHNLNTQALFGQSTSAGEPAPMTWSDFWQQMAEVTLQSPGQWCESCNAQNAVFCAYFTDGAVGLPYGGYDDGDNHSRPQRLSPVIGGVIGAFVTLGLAGLLALIAFFAFGIRFRREPRKSSGSSSPKISSPLSSPRGGFKGGEKLASDVDLPRGANDAHSSFGASIVSSNAESGGAAGGHRRVESWEMRGRKSEELERQAREAV